MKKGIHPEYKLTTVTCSCGSKFQTRSTKPAIHVDICSKCHPFFTGKQKLVDATGQVEKFLRRYGLRAPAETAPAEGTQKAETQPSPESK